MATITRQMIVERHAVAGRMAGQRFGVQGYDLQQPQPPAHLSALPFPVWCPITKSSELSTLTIRQRDIKPLADRCANDTGRLQAGRPAVIVGTIRSRAGISPALAGHSAGSPEAVRG